MSSRSTPARVATKRAWRSSSAMPFCSISPAAGPAYSLVIRMSSTVSDIIVDTATTRPAIENYGINANYVLTEIASGKPVVNGQTFARVSYDVPGQEQRFARMRGLRDAETRAAKVIADNIQARLASYFAAGT